MQCQESRWCLTSKIEVPCTGCRSSTKQLENGNLVLDCVSHVTNSKRFELPNDFVDGRMLVFGICTCEFWFRIAAALTSFLMASVRHGAKVLLPNTAVKVQSGEERYSYLFEWVTSKHWLCRSRLPGCLWMSMTWLASGWKWGQIHVTVDSLELPVKSRRRCQVKMTWVPTEQMCCPGWHLNQLQEECSAHMPPHWNLK